MFWDESADGYRPLRYGCEGVCSSLAGQRSHDLLSRQRKVKSSLGRKIQMEVVDRPCAVDNELHNSSCLTREQTGMIQTTFQRLSFVNTSLKTF